MSWHIKKATEGAPMSGRYGQKYGNGAQNKRSSTARGNVRPAKKATDPKRPKR